jgi:hypothetical protein
MMKVSAAGVGGLGRAIYKYNSIVPAAYGRSMTTTTSSKSNFVVLADDAAYGNIKGHAGKKVLYFTASW